MAAHAHHHEDGCWGHWLYEFGESEFRALNKPTGRSIHTSDYGGFYPDQNAPEHVAQTFMLKFVNRSGAGAAF